jgi:hypothetical protein
MGQYVALVSQEWPVVKAVVDFIQALRFGSATDIIAGAAPDAGRADRVGEDPTGR